MDVKKFKMNTWIGIGIIAVSTIIAGVVFYIVGGSIQQEADAITTARAGVQNQSALINSYSKLKQDAPQAALYQAAMDKLLATQDNLISFPAQIDAIARTESVDTTFSFVGDPVPATSNTAGYVGFKLNVTGPLDNVSAFLKDLESSAPILLSQVDSFDLTQSGSSYGLVAQGKVFFK